MDLAPATVKLYTRQAADIIGGNLPARMTCVLYYRLANDLDVFTGEPVPKKVSL